MTIALSFEFSNANIKYAIEFGALCMGQNRDDGPQTKNTNTSVAVTGSGSVGKCGRLSQPSWLLVRTIIMVILTYRNI